MSIYFLIIIDLVCSANVFDSDNETQSEFSTFSDFDLDVDDAESANSDDELPIVQDEWTSNFTELTVCYQNHFLFMNSIKN